MDAIHYYRVRQSTTHPERSVRKAWYGRTWQAEWEGSGWCPRAWTRRGIQRKARRWFRRGEGWCVKNHNRRVWFRIYVTRRNDPYYRKCRGVRAARRGDLK